MKESEFVPRLTRPEAGNKYYIRKSSGGYSSAIKGKPTDPECDVLANCVGYAYGRFNEIGGWGKCKYLKPVNAEDFMKYAGGLATGQTPRVGACMVWRRGKTGTSSDGAGHVAIVERVVSPDEVVTSESGYESSKPFWTKTRKRGSGNWGQSASFAFLGFIYNPAVESEDGIMMIKETEGKRVSVTIIQVKKGTNGEAVKSMQALLNRRGASLDVDGICGAKTVAAVKEYQSSRGLDADGICGKKTWQALIEG